MQRHTLTFMMVISLSLLLLLSACQAAPVVTEEPAIEEPAAEVEEETGEVVEEEPEEVIEEETDEVIEEEPEEVVEEEAEVAPEEETAGELMGESIATGFSGPQGVFVAEDGTVWVVDAGVGGDEELAAPDLTTGEIIGAPFGETARVVRIDPDGTQTEVATLPSIVVGQETSGGSRLTMLDDTLYVTSGFWREGFEAERPELMAVVARVEDGEAVEVADLWAFEEAENPGGFILESHPYDIAPGPDNTLVVVDAGANDLLQVDPATGEIELIAAFEEGIPAPFPNPARGDAMETDPVPTGVVVDEDGNYYVSFLPGFPFLPGSAKVVQVTPEGEITDFATGLTMITDLVQGPDGNIYAVQFSVAGEEGPTPGTGAIIRVQEGTASEVVIDGLTFPTSLSFTEEGDAYVTVNGVGAPGSGEVVLFEGLTEVEGEPLPPISPPAAEESDE